MPAHKPAGSTKNLADLLLVGTLLADVKSEQVKSIFGGRVHLGKIHLIDGDPGLGKTLLALDLAGVAASSGSACASGSLDPSHVLLAMGLTLEEALGSLRLSTGYETTDEEISRAVAILRSVLTRAPARA